MVLEQLGAAIDRLGLPAERVCIVSDIGCIGTADRYFACHTFHGLHGRSITYAEGIRRARPEVLPIVLIGDGGCGIGTAHLVHAARRNADVKVIVCNNFNFGMTGGQHSVTTPCELLTSTTPSGAVDHPLDVCRTAAVNGAAYVARHDAFDPQLSEHLLRALRTPGFALVDVWELCTAYFVPHNKLNRSSLAELSDRCEMPFGVIHRHDSRHLPVEPAARSQAPLPASKAPPTDRAAGLPWPGRREICVAGSAGQHIRSAVAAMGQIAVRGGLFAGQQDDFPITVRRGFSLSNLVVAPEPIVYAHVDEPDLVIILSADGAARFGGLGALGPECRVLVCEEGVADETTNAARESLDLRPLEKVAGKSSMALAVLAYGLIRAGCAVGKDLSNAARAALAGPFREANLRAIDAGIELAIGRESR
jgi:Pyruvate/2-oxoacid:ferredoxin oxidoreductase gamma subunit